MASDYRGEPVAASDDHRQAVFPTLRYRDAGAAIAWLDRVLGMTVDLVVDGDAGSVAHAQLAHAGGLVFVASTTASADDELRPEPAGSWVYLAVDEVEPHFDRAVAEGAEVVEPVRNEDHGGRGYTVRDPEGNLWSVGTYRPVSGPPA